MGMKNTIIFILSTLILAVSPVFAGGAREIESPWNYELEVTHAGTRSEGELGHLYFEKKEVPWVYDEIIIGNDVYTLKLRVNLWDFGGYFKEDGTAEEVRTISAALSEEDKSRGWYEAFHDGKKAHTPDTWIRVKRDDFSAWVDPARLTDLAESKNFTPRSNLKLKPRD